MKSEEKLGLGPVKRFGARYGRKPKLKFSKIETEQRKFHKCPYCNRMSARRVAVGIWQCRKCYAKFTGKAYSVSRKITEKEAIMAEEPEEPEAMKEPEALEEA